MGAEKQRREGVHPSFLSSYRAFWRGCEWQLFLPAGGLQAAKEDPQIREGIKQLQANPGVYEFSLRRGSSKRVKVYVGETGSLRARHQQYLTDGDHISFFLEGACAEGCTVWRRVRYVATKEDAQRWEKRWLDKYDYAWNASRNGSKRSLSLHQRFCCLCIAAGVDVVERSSPAKAAPMPKQSSSSRKGGQRPQPQFLVSA